MKEVKTEFKEKTIAIDFEKRRSEYVVRYLKVCR